MKNRIYQQDWQSIHPYDKPVSTDIYYVKLANRILSVFNHDNYKEIFTEEEKQNLSIYITAYFEDQISLFGLWSAFIHKHKELYGKFLPFYDTEDDYSEEDINCQDICFLIWSTFQKNLAQEEAVVLNPENLLILQLADEIFAILEEVFPTAPENEVLRDYFHSSDLYQNFLQYRNIAAWLFYDSYLMRDYTTPVLDKKIEDLSKTLAAHNQSPEQAQLILYSLQNELIFTCACGPLSLHISDWISLFTGNEVDCKKALEVKVYPLSSKGFLVKEIDEQVLKLESITGENLNLAKDSLEQGMRLQPNYILYGSLVYFDGLWQLNGLSYTGNESDFQKYKEDYKQFQKQNRQIYDLISKANNGKVISYFKDEKELEPFLDNAILDKKKNQFTNLDKANDIVTFVHPEIGQLIVPDLAVAIKDASNPYYNPEKASDYTLALIMGTNQYPVQFLSYLVENRLLPDLKINSTEGDEYGRKQVQDNLDFVFRFFQWDKF